MNPDIPVAQQVDPDTLGNQIFIITYSALFKINSNPSWTPLHSSIYIPDKIYVYSSVVATFHAPSDLCGSGGMRHKCIHAATSWRWGKPQYDCVFINSDELEPGMHGLSIA